MHRDVKPQNVLVDPEGSAKVTDFGIARSLRDDGLTADGRVLGTTDYVSPEQALGHDVDGQSDIYSLGVVLFEMLTGDVPFHGENQIAVAMKHVREDLPDIQALRPQVSATTAAVLDRMTDKDLAHRYPDAAAARRRPRGGARARGRPHGHLDGRGHRRHPDAAGPTSGGGCRSGCAIRSRCWPVHRADRRRRRDRRSSPRGGPERASSGAPARATSQPPPAGHRIVSVKRGSAHDYDPLGDNEEHDEEASRVVDRDPAPPGRPRPTRPASRARARQASASTSTPGPRSKPSRCSSRPRNPASRSDLRRTPGLRAQVRPRGLDQGRRRHRNEKDKSFKLDTDGTAYRYYLVWITELAEDASSAEISEIRLSQRVAA